MAEKMWGHGIIGAMTLEKNMAAQLGRNSHMTATIGNGV
jgi:hypothetical protein